MHVAFATAKVSAFNCVDKQTIDAVAVTLIIFRRINATLGCNRVRTSRRIMKRKCINLIAKFGQSRRCRCAGQTGANNNYFELALVVRVDEFGVGFVVIPLVAQLTIWNLGV